MQNSVQEQAPPVVVVGAGPTGLAVALELVRQGVGVRIVDKSRTANTESRGTGLGLAIVRALVVAHRGQVRVVETPGGGATFIVRLPREFNGG